MTQKSADGRLVFHWTGQNLDADAAALAAAIAEAIPDLFVRDGGVLVQLDKAGGSNQVNWNVFRVLVDAHVCGVRLVPNGAGWKRDYFTYDFPPMPGPDFKHGGRRPSPNADTPYLDTIDWIYREGLAPLLPRVVE